MRAVVSLKGVQTPFRALGSTELHTSGVRNSEITQTNLEIARSARFFSGLIGDHMTRNRRNGNVSPPEHDNLDNDASTAPVEASFPGRRAETKLEFPTGQPDLEALRSITREWLVPVLVERFLHEQSISSRVRPENTACQFIDTEGGAGTTRTAGGDASGNTVCRSRQKRLAAECQRTRKTTTER